MAKKNPMLQRAEWHDYRSRSMYMVTLSKQGGVPLFAAVRDQGSPAKMDAVVELTHVGRSISEQIRAWLAEFSALRVLNMVVMPDHVHLLVFVTERTVKHFSDILAVYKFDCNRELGCKAFADGYNDKIVTRECQRDRFYNYISDNPRRYLARRLHAEHFRRVLRFTIGGNDYALFGNLFLLNHPCKTVVRYSSRHTDKQRRSKEAEYKEAMRTCGVLVSPFIHPEERAVMQRGVDAGCRIIRIVQNGFSERFKPSGVDFDLCTAGRLLLVAPVHFQSKSVDLRRDAAMAANRLAEVVAALDGTVI